MVALFEPVRVINQMPRDLRVEFQQRPARGADTHIGLCGARQAVCERS